MGGSEQIDSVFAAPQRFLFNEKLLTIHLAVNAVAKFLRMKNTYARMLVARLESAKTNASGNSSYFYLFSSEPIVQANESVQCFRWSAQTASEKMSNKIIASDYPLQK